MCWRRGVCGAGSRKSEVDPTPVFPHGWRAGRVWRTHARWCPLCALITSPHMTDDVLMSDLGVDLPLSDPLDDDDDARLSADGGSALAADSHRSAVDHAPESDVHHDLLRGEAMQALL